MKFSEILKKIQNLPEEKRKIILWSVVVIVGLGLFFFWLYSIKIRLKTFQKEKLFESIGVPKLQEELKEMPEINIPEFEIPQMSEEELKKLEEMMKETPEIKNEK